MIMNTYWISDFFVYLICICILYCFAFSLIPKIITFYLQIQDTNVNISLPIFSIHGNHDDPSGLGGHSCMDILHESKLVNYFGKVRVFYFSTYNHSLVFTIHSKHDDLGLLGGHSCMNSKWKQLTILGRYGNYIFSIFYARQLCMDIDNQYNGFIKVSLLCLDWQLQRDKTVSNFAEEEWS